VTISAGVATGTAPDMGADALIALADAALYAAKHAGRNRVLSQVGPAAARTPDAMATAA
jgi:diguanylate cyclase